MSGVPERVELLTKTKPSATHVSWWMRHSFGLLVVWPDACVSACTHGGCLQTLSFTLLFQEHRLTAPPYPLTPWLGQAKAQATFLKPYDPQVRATCCDAQGVQGAWVLQAKKPAIGTNPLAPATLAKAPPKRWSSPPPIHDTLLGQTR